MKQSWAGKALVTLAVLVLSAPAAAQEDALKDLPGYVDFGELQSFYGEPKVMINIGGMLLSFMTAATKDDPEATELLNGLKGIRVNVFETGGELAPAMDQLQQVKNLLAGQNWEPIVQVNEDDEQVQIFMKADGEGMQGLTVMAVNAEEAVFVNILGQIDPEKIGEVMEKFDVEID
ncbi:DUF4252 domain-containing protein [Marinihelvus fidelis]|nr:DUF4252 domain-containing protein [Marinihelvus fidelis]